MIWCLTGWWKYDTGVGGANEPEVVDLNQPNEKVASHKILHPRTDGAVHETFRAAFTGKLTTYKQYRFHQPFRVENGRWYEFVYDPASGSCTLIALARPS